MKLLRKKKEKATTNNSDVSVWSLIKNDLLRLFWLLMYSIVTCGIIYMLYISLPFLFSRMYASVGSLIGVDFSNLTLPDLAFWVMVSVSVGLVFIIVIAALLLQLIKLLTSKILVTRVIKRKLKR